MKQAFAFILVGLPVVLFAEKTPEEAIQASSKVSSIFVEYDRLVKKADDDRARVIIDLNEKLIVALARSKSEALRSENLPLAMAIDARIKEANEKTGQLKDSIKPSAKITSAAVSTSGEAKGASKLILTYISKSSSKLTESQKAAWKDFAERKTCVNNPFGNAYFINAAGLVCQHHRKGEPRPDEEYRDATIENGALKFGGGEHEMNIGGLSGDSIPMMWKGSMRYQAKFGPYSDAQGAGTPSSTATGKSSTSTDDTVFGRRQSS